MNFPHYRRWFEWVKLGFRSDQIRALKKTFLFVPDIGSNEKCVRTCFSTNRVEMQEFSHPLVWKKKKNEGEWDGDKSWKRGIRRIGANHLRLYFRTLNGMIWFFFSISICGWCLFWPQQLTWLCSVWKKVILYRIFQGYVRSSTLAYIPNASRRLIYWWMAKL